MSEKIIKNKIEELIQFASLNDAITTKDFILNHFNNHEVDIYKTDINRVYYDSHIIDVYPKNMKGIYISIQEGDWDRFGDSVSHSGIDIHIVNPFRNETKTLFIENEKSTAGNVNFDFSEINKESVLRYFQKESNNAVVYKYLHDDLKNDYEVISSVVKTLLLNSKQKSENEREYSDISPNAGMDVYIHDWQDHYLDMLRYFRDGYNNQFLHFAEKDFVRYEENRVYLDNEIERLERIVYYIDHKDDYIAKYDKDKECFYDEQYLKYKMIKADDIVDSLNTVDNNINKNIKRLEELKDKNGFINRFVNEEKILELENEIVNLKDEKHDLQEMLESIRCEIQNIKDEIEERKSTFKNLEYEFDYLLKDTFVEFYDYEENFNTALDLMNGYYKEAKSQLVYLKSMKNLGIELYINGETIEKLNIHNIQYNETIKGRIKKAIQYKNCIDQNKGQVKKARDILSK